MLPPRTLSLKAYIRDERISHACKALIRTIVSCLFRDVHCCDERDAGNFVDVVVECHVLSRVELLQLLLLAQSAEKVARDFSCHFTPKNWSRKILM